jgi:DNA-binding winged helix-turn-helix (wHTH) protein/tetratricopeptide (TPR) repeat protein
MVKAFGAFRLDTANQCLWRADERASLTPKAFDVLRYLVERAGHLVSQDELLEALWPETYVNPEGIRKYILEVRKVLDDPPGQPVFIETLRKRGYQFIAPVTDDFKVARLDPVKPLGNIVGRQAGLAELDEYLHEALGGLRKVVFVTGEAGIGKTTLVDAFQQQVVRPQSIRIARGQCIEGFGGIEAYYPVLEAVGSLLHNAEDGSLVEVFAKRAPTWLIQFPALVQPEQRDSLQREILGSTRERMVREICEALEVISAQEPLVIILEDLHWVDPSTLDLISAIARRREPAKLILVGTYRPVDVVLSQSPLKTLKQDLLLRQLCQEIAIERLEESDVADYLAKIFSAESLPAGLANLIHHNSGGNPLFMAAIVDDMLHKGLIAEDGGQLILTRPLQEVYPGIPETLQELLEIQLEKLTPGERRILESGSVAGEHFSVWAVAAMLDTAPASIEEECDKLANRHQFIRSSGIHSVPDGTPSAHYEFRHALYRQALYRSLSGIHRSKLHLSLGERLMPICTAGKPELASELALHFEEGRDHERAARCWMLAAENAAGRFAYRDSIQVLRRALELAAALAPGVRLELEIEILRRIGDAHYAMGEMSDSAVAYEAEGERAARAGLKTAHIGALLRLSFPAWFLDQARGNEVSRQALEVSGSLDDPLLAAQTRLAVASFRLVYDAWREEDAQACASAQDTIRRLGGANIAQNVFRIHVHALQGDYQEAYRQAAAVIRDASNPTAYVLAAGAMGLVLMGSGRFGEVLRMIRMGRERADKNGQDPWMYIIGDVWLRALCFDFDGVRRVSSVAMRSDAERHAALTRTVARVSSGYAELQQGNPENALEYFRQVLDYRTTPRFFLHWHWRMQAQAGMTETLLSAGDLENAHREADALLQSALSTAEPNTRARAWEIKSRVARAEKDHTGARACIENALAILDKFEIPMAAWQVHRTAGDLSADEGDHARAGEHRSRAKELIFKIADTFDPGEPLRESLLAAPPVRRILA